MRNFLYAAAGMLVALQAQAAPVITFTQGGSSVSGSVIENFDGFADGAFISPATSTQTATRSDAAKPAFGSSGNFAAVHTGGSYMIAFDPAHAFSFVLGSLDTYNTLTLGFADGSQIIYNGSEITDGGQADGHRTSGATNGIVSFRILSEPRIVSALFTSNGDSFEFDNIAISTPEPATWTLMIVGFGTVGAAMRGRKLGNVHAL